MAKAKRAAKVPKKETSITYLCADGEEHTVTFKIPLNSGVGEWVINEAERRGCKNIGAVRAAVAKHY